MLDAYWGEVNIPYTSIFCFYPRWLIEYNDELPMVSSIEIFFLIWKSETHRMTPKYDILCSFVLLVKDYHVSSENNYEKATKFTCQYCNRYLECAEKSEEIIYTNFLCAGMTNLGI